MLENLVLSVNIVLPLLLVMAGRYIYPFVCSLPVLASHVRGG